MKNHLLPITLSLIFFSRPETENKISSFFSTEPVPVSAGERSAADLYEQMNLSASGLSLQSFQYAFKGYTTLRDKKILSDNSLLAICDFTQSSKNKRLYILDMVNGKLLFNTYVAHGRGSGAEYAKNFSNRASSHQSSLGFYITSSVYFGEHGLSLKLKGLEKGFNNAALRRSIVIHGASYVGNKALEKNNFTGRSFGCPAVPQEESSHIIHLLKEGSCIFIYYPSKKYLQQSKLLNG